MDWAVPALLIPLAAICFPTLGLVAILVFVISMRYLRLKETRMLLDRGMAPDAIVQQRASRPSRMALFTGIIVTMIGLAISVALYPIGLIANSPYFLGLGPWMIPGLLPLFVGLALLLWHFLSVNQQAEGGTEAGGTGNEGRRGHERPGRDH
ncbi:MAG: DUF6249 domain-containing protein [Sphingomonadaceae bacterium]